MSLPWTCDALLERHERYSSLKFRRIARSFMFERLDYADGVELAAFLAVVPPNAAAFLFEWKARGIAAAQRVEEYLKNDVGAVQAVEENRRDWTREDGLLVLRRMQEGGWTGGVSLPGIVRTTLTDMRSDGLSQPEIGRRVGLTLDQVRVACGRTRGTKPPPRVGAVFAV